MSIKSEFWKKVRDIRLNKKISQEKLSELSGIHRTYISSVERGLKNISVENIEKIALALKIKVKDLFNF